MPSRRQERVGKRVIQELVEAVRDLKHVDLGFITLTRCEISPDLRHAKVFVSVWGEEKERERSLALLKGNASRLRRSIGRPLGLKVLPELHFEFDGSLETSDRISRLIKDARQTDLNPEPLSPEEEAALAAAAAESAAAASAGVDVFETVRRDVEEELLDDVEDDDDQTWRPIDLEKLPEE